MSDTKENSTIITLIKLLCALGGGAVIFYTLGFTVVQTYIYKIGLEGMFWLSNEYYGEAGAKFLLEMVRAPLVAPHIFLPYLILLFFLIPKSKNLKNLKTTNAELSTPQWIKLSTLLLLMFFTYFLALFYDKFTGNLFYAKLIDLLLFDPVDNPSPLTKQSLAFFSLVTPMVIVLGRFLYRFRGLLKPDSLSRGIHQIGLIIYLVFFTIVPIAYGFHLYDWKIVPIKEPYFLEQILAPYAKYDMSEKIWLLGQFRDKYLFFKKDTTDRRGVIEAFNEDQIKHLNFDIAKTCSLREQMEELPGMRLIKNKQKIMDMVLD